MGYRPRYSFIKYSKDCAFSEYYKEYYQAEYFQHDKVYLEALADVKRNAYIKVDGPITLDDILQGFAKYHEKSILNYQKSGMYYYTNTASIQTPALVAAWAGEPEKAKEYIKWAQKIVSSYEDKVFQYEPKNWIELLQEKISNPEELRRIARAEVDKFKFNDLPYQDIVGVSYQEPYFKK